MCNSSALQYASPPAENDFFVQEQLSSTFFISRVDRDVVRNTFVIKQRALAFPSVGFTSPYIAWVIMLSIVDVFEVVLSPAAMFRVVLSLLSCFRRRSFTDLKSLVSFFYGVRLCTEDNTSCRSG